jgi:hypothetical protein
MGDDYFESQKANGFLQEKERKWAPKEPLFPTFDPFWYKEEELSGCFSPCSIVNGNEVRFLANHFVDERGKISLDRLKESILFLKKKLYALGTGAEESLRRKEKILSSCEFLYSSQQARILIHRLGRPFGNRAAEEAIKQTLLLPEDFQVTEIETRRAVVAAFLGTLRQSLGSCFATAPAIVVHENQPLVFLENLEELFATSRLKKVMGGQEFQVPESLNWGEGDLHRKIQVSRKKEENSQPFWRSFTLKQALFAGTVISSIPEKEEEMFLLFLPAITLLCGSKSSAWVSLSDLLLASVVLHVGVSLQDYEQFCLKSKGISMHMEVEITSSQTNSESSYANKVKLFHRVEALQNNLVRYLISHTDLALLKMWEFTLASFTEVKLGMCRNNFYLSLGVNWDDEGGIGNVLYEAAKQRVDEANRLVEESQAQYDVINTEMIFLEQRLKNASNEKELQWMKMEFQSRQAEQYHLRQQCDIAVEKANKVAKLHELLLAEYDRLLKEYFQEIYDPDLHEVELGPYDDSPAGFRLLYKHGRSNSSLWTVIYSLEEWKDALASFFSITEQELLLLPELQVIESEVRQIISRLVQHIRSDFFVETSLKRYARSYGAYCPPSPLQELDKVEKKPWVYTSGGSMSSLVEAYFGNDSSPKAYERWVENETELLAYIIEGVRLIQKRSEEVPPQKVLMHSPTHAFVVLPYHESFRSSWEEDFYSYTWIKKTLIDPSTQFYNSYALDQETTYAINETVAFFLDKKEAKSLLRELSVIPNFLRSYEYVKEVTRLFQLEVTLRKYASQLESFDWERFFFSHLPYISLEQIEPLISQICQRLFLQKNFQNTVLSTIQALGRDRRVISKKVFFSVLKEALIEKCQSSFYERNLLPEALEHLHSLLSMPAQPVIFADTNWMKEYFAFAVSPVTLSLKLWAMNSLGTEGFVMNQWAPWMNGLRKDRTWGLFINPDDYTMKQVLNPFFNQTPGIQYFH